MNTKFSYFRIYICAGVRRTSTRQAKKGGRTVIEVKNLTKRYGDHTAVDHLSFQVEEGQIYGFLGPNMTFWRSRRRQRKTSVICRSSRLFTWI